MTRQRAWLVCAAAVITAAASCALCAGAVLAHAPVAVVPLLAVCCVGLPIFGAWQAPAALDVIRRTNADSALLASLRQDLARLPEAEHPLGW